jgi:hypothetical protein
MEEGVAKEEIDAILQELERISEIVLNTEPREYKVENED